MGRKNHEKCRKIQSCEQTSANAIRQNGSFKGWLSRAGVPALISACVTESQFLAQNAPSALNTALARGRFELNCPQASGTVLSQKVTYINGLGVGMGGGGGYEWTEYTIGVRGCGKSAVFETMCRDQDNCNAFAGNGQIIQNQQ